MMVDESQTLGFDYTAHIAYIAYLTTQVWCWDARIPCSCHSLFVNLRCETWCQDSQPRNITSHICSPLHDVVPLNGPCRAWAVTQVGSKLLLIFGMVT